MVYLRLNFKEYKMPGTKQKFVVYGMKRKTLVAVITLLGLGSLSSLNRNENMRERTQEKMQQIALLKDPARFPPSDKPLRYRPFSHALRNELKNVDYQVDTVDFCPFAADDDGLYQNLGYFDEENKKIIIHHFRDIGLGDNVEPVISRLNDFDAKQVVLAHEYRHVVNAGYDNRRLNLRDYAQSLRDDEISGCIASVLLKREKFLESGDYKVFDGSPEAEYYAEAVKSGLFYPQFGKMSRLEQRVLILAGSKIWEQNRSAGYESLFREKIAAYAKEKNFAALTRNTDKEYRKLSTHYYTFNFDGRKIDLSRERPKPMPLSDDMETYIKILLFKIKTREILENGRQTMQKLTSEIRSRW